MLPSVPTNEIACTGQKYILYPVKIVYGGLVSKTSNFEHKNYSPAHLVPTLIVRVYR